MQTKKKYSLMALVSAFIIGIPAVYLSTAFSNEDQDVDQNVAQEANSASSMKTSNKQLDTINQAPAPAAGTKAVIAMKTQAESEHTYQSPIDRIREIQNKNELHHSLLEDNEKFKRYPEYNQVFSSPERDPILQRYEIEERTTQNPEDQSRLTIWSDKKYYLQGDQAKLFASLRDAEGQAIPTKFIGQLIFNEQESLQTLEFIDSNQDGIYEQSIPLNSTEKNLQAGVYKVLIVNSTNKVSDALTFILSKPEIELTGNYKDVVSAKGELLISAEVVVTEKNRFYFQASLYTTNQLPIGTTQQALELNPGKHWVSLVFDGSLIRDAGESGPFLLKNVSVAKVTLPMQRAPMLQPEFFTQDYALEQFKSIQATESDNLQANNVKN